MFKTILKNIVNNLIYDEFGYDKNGFNIKGIHKKTNTLYDPQGYNQKGYDKNGFNIRGIHYKTNTIYNPQGYDKNGFNKNKLHKITATHLDPRGFNYKGINVDTKKPYDKNGYDIRGILVKNKTDIKDKKVTNNKSHTKIEILKEHLKNLLKKQPLSQNQKKTKNDLIKKIEELENKSKKTDKTNHKSQNNISRKEKIENLEQEIEKLQQQTQTKQIKKQINRLRKNINNLKLELTKNIKRKIKKKISSKNLTTQKKIQILESYLESLSDNQVIEKKEVIQQLQELKKSQKFYPNDKKFHELIKNKPSLPNTQQNTSNKLYNYFNNKVLLLDTNIFMEKETETLFKFIINNKLKVEIINAIYDEISELSKGKNEKAQKARLAKRRISKLQDNNLIRIIGLNIQSKKTYADPKIIKVFTETLVKNILLITNDVDIKVRVHQFNLERKYLNNHVIREKEIRDLLNQLKFNNYILPNLNSKNVKSGL